MRRIKRAKQLTKIITQDTLKDKVFATVDGVLEPIVYDAGNIDGTTNKQSVFMTPPQRLLKRKNASNTKSVSTIIESEVVDGVETAVQTTPLFVYNYQRGFAEVTSGNNIQTWLSSVGSNALTQAEADKRPDIGVDGRGINGFNPAVFSIDRTEHFVFSNRVTISGDFTIFMYVKIVGHPLNKYMRFLGDSSDGDIFFSAGDVFNKSYILSFSSSSQVIFSSSTPYYTPTSDKILITLIRKGTNLEIRENGVRIGAEVTPTTDFTFNLFGKRGSSNLTFNGSLYHLSAYNFALSNNLVDLENSIITQASLARE